MISRRIMLIWVVLVSAVFMVKPKIIMAAAPFCEHYEANSDDPRVSTALGCIPVKIEDFAAWLLTYIFGIAGGIAFLLMVYGFIMLSTVGGDPKKMQGARETVSSAITGLIVCIFAVFLLRLIAVNILRIPGIN